MGAVKHWRLDKVRTRAILGAPSTLAALEYDPIRGWGGASMYIGEETKSFLKGPRLASGHQVTGTWYV